LTPIYNSFFFRLSVLDRYDSDPLPTIEHNDMTFRTSLVYVF
jgi:hypothetical protein